MNVFGNRTTEVSFAQTSFSDLVARRERQLWLANTAYVGFAAVGLVAAIVSSLLAASGKGGGLLLGFGAVVLGLLAGIAPLVLGRLIEAVAVRPEIPKHLQRKLTNDDIEDVADEVDEAERRQLIMGFAAVYAGLALLSLSFTVMLASAVGLTTPIFGVLPPAYVIPLAIEGMQVVSLLAGVRLGRDLEVLRSQSSELREPELTHQLKEQKLTVELEERRLDAETQLIEAGMKNRARRVHLREELRLQQRTVKSEAAETAKTEAALAAMRREAGFEIAKAETQADIKAALQTSALRIAMTNAELDRKLKAIEQGEMVDPTVGKEPSAPLTQLPQHLNGHGRNGNGTGGNHLVVSGQ